MSTECTAGTLQFQAVARRTVQARFDGGALTSDGGAVLPTAPRARARDILRGPRLKFPLDDPSSPIAGMPVLPA